MGEAVQGVMGTIGWDVVWKPALHFVSSGLLGLLVYWLTSTILMRCYCGYLILGSRRVGFSIHSFSLSLAVSSSILLHILVDFTSVGF